MAYLIGPLLGGALIGVVIGGLTLLIVGRKSAANKAAGALAGVAAFLMTVVIMQTTMKPSVPEPGFRDLTVRDLSQLSIPQASVYYAIRVHRPDLEDRLNDQLRKLPDNTDQDLAIYALRSIITEEILRSSIASPDNLLNFSLKIYLDQLNYISSVDSELCYNYAIDNLSPAEVINVAGMLPSSLQRDKSLLNSRIIRHTLQDEFVPRSEEEIFEEIIYVYEDFVSMFESSLDDPWEILNYMDPSPSMLHEEGYDMSCQIMRDFMTHVYSYDESADIMRVLLELAK